MVETTHQGAERALRREPLHHVSWGAIFLGLVIAIAIQILLGLLGIAIGFSAIDPTEQGGLGTLGIGSAIYLVVTQIIALFIGGYAAARVNPTITDQSAIFHGGSVWAIAFILVFWLGTTSVGMIISGLGGAVANIGQATGQAVKATLPQDFNLSLPDLSFDNLPQPVQDTLRQQGITPQNVQQELRSAYREVISRDQQQRIVQQLQQAASDIMQSPMDTSAQDIQQTVDKIFGGPQGILTQQDLQELERVVQNRLNLSSQEMQQIMNQVQQAATQARESAVQAIQTAQEQAAQAAEAISDRIASIALWTFIAGLLGLIAAVAGAKIGESNKEKQGAV